MGKKEEEKFVGHLAWWEARYGSRKNGNDPELFCRSVFCRSYRNDRKTQIYGTVHAFRSVRTVQTLPLRARGVQGEPNNSNCHGHRSSRGPALRRLLYLTRVLPDHLMCVDEMDDEDIPDEKIVAAVAVGASIIEHWSTVSGIATVWSG